MIVNSTKNQFVSFIIEGFTHLPIYIGVLCMLNVNMSFCQCLQTNPVRAINNEPEYSLNASAKTSEDIDHRLIIYVDTTISSKHISCFGSSYNNKYCHVTKKDSAEKGMLLHYIKNLENHEMYFLAKSLSWTDAPQSMYFLKDGAILIYRSLEERHIASFSFETKEIKKYNLHSWDAIGFNDASIFINLDDDYKYQGKKYKKETLLSLSCSSINKILDPDKNNNLYKLKLNNGGTGNTLFYSPEFKVTQNISFESKDECYTDYYYSNYVSYHSQCIDSFITVERNHNQLFKFNLQSDTLSVMEYESHYFSNSNHSTQVKKFRKYLKSQLIATWNSMAWADTLPVLKNALVDYKNIGDILLVKINVSILNSEDKELMGQFTVNNIPIKSSANNCNVILAFDIMANKFLGYPLIDFTNFSD